MAGDEDKTVVEGKGGEEQETSEKKKKGSNKLILFGGIGLGAIIIGVALTIFVIKPMTSSSDAEQEQQTEEVSHKEEAKEEESGGHGGGEEGEEGGGTGNICAIKDIVINPAGTGGSRFLSVSFAFELGSPSEVTLFESREAAIRDALITILSSKTVAQLTDPKQKEIARYQIKKRVAQLMKLDEIAGVYYTDFVLQ